MSKDKSDLIKLYRKNKAVYCERVSYGHFDVVINADAVYYSMNVNSRIVIEEVAKREKEDRDLYLLPCRTQIQLQIKGAGGCPAIVNTTENVRTK